MSTYTLTFGDQAENHVGMQQIGELADEGFTVDELLDAMQRFIDDGYNCDLIKLHNVNGVPENCDEAAVLIVRNGVQAFVDADAMFDEQADLEYDTKAYMYGRVVNKHARHNICFADFNQEPDYKDKKGRIVSYADVPLLEKVLLNLPGYLGEKAQNLTVEGNLYYDVRKCGIGFHGDSERRKVIAVRLGNDCPLEYQWFYKSKPVGERTQFVLGHGDLYVMSEKATGWDWKKKNVYTLRHAAGCDKYTTIK